MFLVTPMEELAFQLMIRSRSKSNRLSAQRRARANVAPWGGKNRHRFESHFQLDDVRSGLRRFCSTDIPDPEKIG